MKPQITIGIAFKNPGRYFQLALKSIFAQTYTDWELILIDGGSTDDSLLLAQRLKDFRVRVYSDGESKGLSVRLNQMVKLAQAPYFARMDADDIMHPERLSELYVELTKHDKNTVIGTAVYSIDCDSKVIGYRAFSNKQRFSYEARYSFIHPTVAASTEWFCKNPYSEYFAFFRTEDIELWSRTSTISKFINLPNALIYYREGGCFSLEKYLGSHVGNLYLIYRYFYKYKRYKFILLLCLHLIKMLFIVVLDYIGLSELLISKRYRKLNSSEFELANLNLETVMKQYLPL